MERDLNSFSSRLCIASSRKRGDGGRERSERSVICVAILASPPSLPLVILYLSFSRFCFCFSFPSPSSHEEANFLSPSRSFLPPSAQMDPEDA